MVIEMSRIKLPVNAASITDFRRDNVATVAKGNGNAVAVYNRNNPVFYCVPPELYALYIELQEDAELNHIADERL